MTRISNLTPWEAYLLVAGTGAMLLAYSLFLIHKRKKFTMNFFAWYVVVVVVCTSNLYGMGILLRGVSRGVAIPAIIVAGLTELAWLSSFTTLQTEEQKKEPIAYDSRHEALTYTLMAIVVIVCATVLYVPHVL